MLLKFYVEEKDRDKTVHSVLRRDLKVSATMLRRLKLADVIHVSGKSVFTNYKLSPGETLEVDIGGAEQPCDNLPEYGALEMLFENEGLLAVNKPSGVLVHPSRSRNTGTLSNFVAGYISGMKDDDVLCATPPMGTQMACHAVNRLDRDTSGVVLFAKNSYMKDLASKALSASEARREYLALVYGKMPECGTIDAPIKRFEERNLLRVVAPDGQRAVTHFETLEVFDIVDGNESASPSEQGYVAGALMIPAIKGVSSAVSLVRFRLETGRTHQIRVHGLHIGHPILGDKLYCTNESMATSQMLGVETQALHAQLLALTEPLSGAYMEITAPWKVPADMEKSPQLMRKITLAIYNRMCYHT
ncbi:MAG: RluA family pseudouridine synthase [Oscillospiraceae bacterium]|nr:RluA family pseudouridine synthase [Oscillospiraceae bacterium]